MGILGSGGPAAGLVHDHPVDLDRAPTPRAGVASGKGKRVFTRHPGEGRGPGKSMVFWIPVFTGMTYAASSTSLYLRRSICAAVFAPLYLGRCIQAALIILGAC